MKRIEKIEIGKDNKEIDQALKRATTNKVTPKPTREKVSEVFKQIIALMKKNK